MNILNCSFIIVSFLLSSITLANTEQKNLGQIVCEKASNSKKKFELKAKIIAEKLHSLTVVHLDKTLILTCNIRDIPITDDGGERCTYDCIFDVKHGTDVLKIQLYEDFVKRIQLLKIESSSGS